MMTVVLSTWLRGSICTTRRSNIARFRNNGCCEGNEQRHAPRIKGEDHAEPLLD